MTAFTSVGNGLWTDPDTWDVGGGDYPGKDASSDDTVTLGDGTEVVLDAEALIQIASLSVLDTGLPDQGDLELGAGSVLAVTGDIDTAGLLYLSAGEGAILSVPNLTLSATETFTALGDCAILGNVIVNGGEIGSNVGSTIEITGNLACDTGLTIGTANILLSGTEKTLAWDSALVPLNSVTVEGSVTTSANVYTRELTVMSGGTLTVSHVVYVWPLEDNPIDIQGTVNGAGTLLLYTKNATRNNSGRVVIGGTITVYLNAFAATETWVQTGEFDISGPLLVYGSGSNQKCILQVGEITLRGTLTLGGSSTVRSGSLVLTGGVANLTNIVGNVNAKTANTLSLGSASVLLSGTIDCTNIDNVTSSGANIHGGTVTAVSSTGIIHTWGSTQGAGNSISVTQENSYTLHNAILGVC